MPQQNKKAHNIIGLAEGAYLSWVIPAVNYARFMLEAGGNYSLVVLPLFEFIKAALYWRKSRQPGFSDSRLKIVLNHTFNAFKTLAAGAGISLAIAGMIAYGFGILIATGYLNVFRYLGKALRSAADGNRHKLANNLHKATVGAMISSGFTLITFFPPLAWIGGMIVLGAAAHIMLLSATGLIKGEEKPLAPLTHVYSPVVASPEQSPRTRSASISSDASYKSVVNEKENDNSATPNP